METSGNERMSRSMWFAAALVAAAVALVHLVSAGRYGFFANELYFIVCGRHPAIGYVDQPPLVPLLAAATQIGGINVWLLRLPAVLAAVALVPLVVAFARLLGGSTRAAWLAAIAAAASPMITAMSAALSTSTFEPLAFTAVAYFVARGVLLAESRAFWWAGLVAGIALEAKYGIVFWLLGIGLGLALFNDRSIWRSRDFWIGAGIVALIALPNAAWQLAHGLPFLELVRNDNAGNLTGSPLRFLLDQLFLVNVLLAPLWIAGIVAPFASKRMAPARFLSVAFVVTAILVVTTHGKDYYLAGAYPTMFAVGAVACTRLWRWFVALWAVLTAANAALALPFVLPLDPPGQLAEMLDQNELSSSADGESVYRSAAGMHFLPGVRVGRGRAAHRRRLRSAARPAIEQRRPSWHRPTLKPRRSISLGKAFRRRSAATISITFGDRAAPTAPW